MRSPRVVIVGAGFGGLECAKRLARARVRVLLIDRNNYHLFTPLLYQVASSLLNPSDIAYPVRATFRGRRRLRFRRGEVTGVDFGRRAVLLAGGSEERYDFLVLAAGSETNFFGMESVERRALGLKDLPEALELRNHILACLEAASQSETDDEASRYLTFVIVGGGPTGVEYAGALSELVRLVLPGEFPELARRRVRIILVEALPELLPAFAPELGRNARAELESRGIEVMTGARVAEALPGAVRLAGGEEIAAETLVWAAGVRPAALATTLETPRSRSGRLQVDPFLRIEGRKDVFAIGDIASVPLGDREVPMLSAPAMQEGRLAAENIVRSARGLPLRAFHYRDRGAMATIGRNSAVASIGPLRLTGFPGWVTWLVVHLYYLIGFRNRLAVLLGWAWNYLRYDRPVRIITRARARSGDAP